MNMDSIKHIGLEAARKSGEILMHWFGNLPEIKKKGVIDLVTKADIESEKAIKEIISGKFPHHLILAEESGLSGEQGDGKWIIDPLDGTTNYSHGLGLFSTSIAFESEGEIVFGVVFNPVTDECFCAEKNMGATLNGTAVHVSDIQSVSDSLLVTGFPYNLHEIFPELSARFTNCLKSAQGVRRLGSAALDLCYMACGRFDGFWEQNLKPWDTAAGFLIAKEAGALVTDFSGMPFSPYRNEILATNGNIHQEMLELLQI